MNYTLFESNIRAFDLDFRSDEVPGGIILTSRIATDPGSLTPQEFFALETALRFDVDAVYFRYFDDGRESIPQIYLYDNTNDQLTGKEAEIHVKVWSGCLVPIFIIINKAEVKIFDAREKAEITNDELRTTAIDTIQLSGDAVRQFSSKDFATGLFWEDKKYQKKFLFTTSAYKDLLDGLKRVYSDFQHESGLSSQVSLKLLVQCLLIKYLEERDEESGYFAKRFFKNNFNCNTFCEVISNGKLLDLLDKLSVNFNGKIFEWNSADEKSERIAIGKAKVRKLAEYLDGSTKNDQYVLWRLYSFSHLPVELISSVYEELLGKGKKDTVYTPDMVAGTLIDECMPLRSPKENFRLIDVSCGSGIFLVKAYKRIIQWWRYSQWKNTGSMDKPDLATMKQLLKRSIHGIDIQGDAVRLSVFSLALALLDDLDPKTIWTKLKFENLSIENVVERDFFEFIGSQSNKDFDLVIGNPPFNPPDGLSNGAFYHGLKEKYSYQCDIAIPDFNLALLFLVEGAKLLKRDAILCMIQPSGPLLYQRDKAFKEAIFSKYNILQIIDFTLLGDVLWGKANVATAAFFLQNAKPDKNDISHITLQRTPANLKKLFLEIDHYDVHFVPKDTAKNNPFVWKANLIGGGRIVGLLERLSQFNTLGDFLAEKSEKDGWKIGEGFIEKGTNPKPAKYITGHQYLPSEALTEGAIDWNKVQPCKIKLFKRPREIDIYRPPHLLIKENVGKTKLSVYFSNEYLVFRANIIGINCPSNQKSELRELETFFQEHNDLLRFYILATSSQLSISKATVPLKEDFMNLPYSKRKSDLKISRVENVLVDEILTHRLTTSKKHSNTSNEQQIRMFVKTFCQTLNSVYKVDDTEFRFVKLLDAGKYSALHFEYSANQHPWTVDKVDLEEYLNQFVLAGNISKHFSYQRIVKYYGKDTILLIKPKSFRYWSQSIALRDADETFTDYVKTGF
jgi:hypothetical protein